MNECEALVTDLLRAIAWLSIQLSQRSLDLTRRGDAADIGTRVYVEEYNWKDEANRQIAISAELDAKVRGVGSVTWLLSVLRTGTTWQVEREVAINRDDGVQELALDMPAVELGNSKALAESLQSLLTELLDFMPDAPNAAAAP